MKNLSRLSNAELNIMLKKLENKYEAEKTKVSKMIKGIEDIRSQYKEVDDELKKRNGALWKTAK